MNTREICKACGRESAVGFSVPDDVWLAAAGEFYWNKVLCIGCFAARADARRVRWDLDIHFWPVSLVTFEEPD